MDKTLTSGVGPLDGTKFRLRLKVYGKAVAEHGWPTLVEQVDLFGISRATLHRIRAGESPSLASAMRMADVLQVPVDELFERTDA